MKRLLVITTAFAPENAIGAIRLSKLTKYLFSLNWDITVIAPKLTDNMKVDETLDCEEIRRIRIIRVPYSKFFNDTYYRKRDKLSGISHKLSADSNRSKISAVKAIIARFAKSIYTSARNADWKKQVFKYMKSHLKQQNYDIVISSYPSKSAHFAAMYAYKKRIAKNWIADFQDPMIYESLNSKFEYKLNEISQKKICTTASIITYVTKNMILKLSKDFSNKEKFHYLPLGFDEDDFDLAGSKRIPESKYLQISYVGSLYGGLRNFSILFKIISELNNEGRIELDKIRIKYAGRDFSVLYGQAERFGVQEILEDAGYLSRKESIALQAHSDIILVSTWNTENELGIIPGKLYECFLLKKPIIAIVNGTKPDSELKEMVNASRLGIAVETMLNNQEELLKDFLVNQYNRAIKGVKYTTNINEKYLKSFSYKSIAEELDVIMKELLEKN